MSTYFRSLPTANCFPVKRMPKLAPEISLEQANLEDLEKENIRQGMQITKRGSHFKGFRAK